MSTSISRSISASGSSYDRNKSSGRFHWSSNWYFIMGTVCYSVSYTGYNTFGTEGKPSIWQYLVVAIVLGLPVFYTQTFLGQFCQMGMLNFRYMMPMSRGLMYIFLVCVILKTVRGGYVLTDTILYFLMCFQVNLPWKVCPDGYKRICNGVNMTQDYPHTAYVYWRYIYAQNPKMDLSFDLTPPDLSTIISFCFQWGLIFILAAVSYKNHKKVTRGLFYAHMAGLSLLLASTYCWIGYDVGFLALLFARFEEFFEIHTWLESARSVIADLSLAELYNMYAGAHLSPSANSGTLSVACVFVIGLSNFLASALTSICNFAVVRNTGTQLSVVNPHHLGIGVGNILVVIPQGLSFLTLPQGWSAIFFASCICLLASNQVLHLISIQMTIVDMYPNFDKYKTYLIGGCCLFSCVVGIFLLPRGMFMISQYALENTVDNLMCVCVGTWTFTIYWLYGVGRLSDDIQFLKGEPPTKFWKILWSAIPGVFFVLACVYSYFLMLWDTYYIMTNLCVIGGCLIPLVVIVFVEIYASLKKGNLLGIFKPHPKWGPPDAEDRLYRKFYNPRTETKFEAERLMCHHHCLTESDVLKNTIKQEDQLRAEFFRNKFPDENYTPTTTQSECSSISSIF